MDDDEELAATRSAYAAVSPTSLRMVLVVGWFWVRIKPGARRDDGLQQRLNLVHILLRERKQAN